METPDNQRVTTIQFGFVSRNMRQTVTSLDRSVNLSARLARSQIEAGLSDLSRRDNRTQPGVSTPGPRPHHDAP
jgi:hypothetical protein